MDGVEWEEQEEINRIIEEAGLKVSYRLGTFNETTCIVFVARGQNLAELTQVLRGRGYEVFHEL